MRAQYLLRFDDICPTMNWAVWQQVEETLQACRQRPILAVVPENRDPHLVAGPAMPRFWDRVRAWQAAGWTIAMHGYQHRYTSADCGLLRMNRYSEFAGHSEDEQHARLAAGRKIFESEGIHSGLFVAPAHSFDWLTVKLLAQLGFRYISDGFSLWPRKDHLGIVWIPQQLWSLRYRPFGIWTVCLHFNNWHRDDLNAFRTGLQRYLPAMIDIQTALNSAGMLPDGLKRLSGLVYGGALHLRIRLSHKTHRAHSTSNKLHL